MSMKNLTSTLVISFRDETDTSVQLSRPQIDSILDIFPNGWATTRGRARNFFWRG